jgi:uncharacterized protein YukE/pimeloyl-ACP methyl ester carboxylesterase
MVWTVENPGVGNVAGIRRIATLRDTALADVQKALASIGTTAADLPSNWSGAAADSHLNSMESLVPDLQQLEQSYTTHRDALTAYAASVESIQDATDPLIAKIDELETDLGSLNTQRYNSPVPMPTPAEAPENDLFLPSVEPWDEVDLATALTLDADIKQTQQDLHQAGLQLGELVSERAKADADCVAALSLSNPRSDLTQTQRDAVDAVAPEDLAAYLLTLTTAQRSALLLEDPTILERLKAAGPNNAADVAALWVSLGAATAVLLALKYPKVVGNLEGALYDSRDVANTTTLATDQAALTTRLEGLKEGSAEYTEVAAQLAALNEVKKALGSGRDDNPPRFLISLEYPDGIDSATPPLAAVALGNLDTADNSTYLIPGMDTTVEDGLGTWTANALEVYKLQKGMLEGKGSDESAAVVAWVGYETPTKQTVAGNDHAIAGAEKLNAALDGYLAVQGATGNDAHLGMLAHSYGSTTAMLALVDNPGVDSLGVFGSAGQVSGTTVDIPDDQFYYVMGDYDVVAPIGQAMSGGKTILEQMGSPAGDYSGVQDPRFDPSFINPDVQRIEGSRMEYYDDNGDLQYLEPAIGEWGHGGYMDPGTSSLYNLSAAALGDHSLLVEDEVANVYLY